MSRYYEIEGIIECPDDASEDVTIEEIIAMFGKRGLLFEGTVEEVDEW